MNIRAVDDEWDTEDSVDGVKPSTATTALIHPVVGVSVSLSSPQ